MFDCDRFASLIATRGGAEVGVSWRSYRFREENDSLAIIWGVIDVETIASLGVFLSSHHNPPPWGTRGVSTAGLARICPAGNRRGLA